MMFYDLQFDVSLEDDIKLVLELSYGYALCNKYCACDGTKDVLKRASEEFEASE